MFGDVPVVPERAFPPGDASLVMTAGTEPEHIVVVGVEEDREQRAAGFAARPSPAAQCRRIVVLGRLRDDLRPVGEEALARGGKGATLPSGSRK